jgi:hypothetical protein
MTGPNDYCLRSRLDSFFKVSLALFVISVCFEIARPSKVPPQTTPVYDLNAKIGKLQMLGSSSVNWGTKALQNEQPPDVSIDNVEKRKLVFRGQYYHPASNPLDSGFERF